MTDCHDQFANWSRNDRVRYAPAFQRRKQRTSFVIARSEATWQSVTPVPLSFAGGTRSVPTAAPFLFARQKEMGERKTARGNLPKGSPWTLSSRPKGEPPGSPFGFPLQRTGDGGRRPPHQSAALRGTAAASFPQGKPTLRGTGDWTRETDCHVGASASSQ